MAQQIINTGAVANDGTGDPLRTAFTETNNNFTEIYTAGPVDSNVRIVDNTILTINTNGNLVLAPNGTGVVQSNVNIVPNQANVRNLGSSTRRWSTVYTQYLNVTNGTTVDGDLTVGGNLTVTGNTVQIGNLVTDAKTLQLANTVNTANAATGSGITVGASDNIATLLYNSTGNVWTTNIGVSAVGNVTAPYFIGNGSQLTGLPVPYGNSNVVTLLAGFGSNTISTTGNVSGGYFIGNGSTLTNIAGANVSGTVANATYATTAGSATTAGTVTTAAQGNITSVGVLTSLSATGNVTAGNVLTSAEVVASGVIQTGTGFSTGGYLSVDGSTDLHDTNIIGTLSVNTIRSDDSTVVKIQDGVEIDGDAVINGNVTADYFIGNAAALIGLNSAGEHAANLGVSGWTELNSNVIVQVTGNANSYAQINFQNISNGTHATTDYIATAEFGTDSTYFVDMGIASGNYDATDANNSLGNSLYPQDSYLYAMGGNSVGGFGGNLVVGSNEPGGVVRVIANGSTVDDIVATFSNVGMAINGDINFNGGGITQTINEDLNIVVQDEEDDGWSLYNTITDSIGNNLSQTQLDSSSFTIRTDMTGAGHQWQFDGNTLQVSTNSLIRGFESNVVVQSMSGANAVVASLQSVSNVNDPNVFSTFDATTTSANIKVYNGGSNGGIEYAWKFDNSGNLTLPQGGVVYETNIPDGGLNGKTIALKPQGGTDADQQLLIYPTTNDANHLHLTSGNLYSTELFLGDDNLYVKLANTGDIVINSNDGAGNTAQWTFDNFGTMTLPGNMIISGNTSVFGANRALIQPADDLPLIVLSSGANGAVSSIWVEDIANVGTSNIAAVYANPVPGSGNVRIVVGQNGVGSGPNLWDFDTTGNLTVPGNIIVATGIVGSGASPAPYLSGFSSVSAITVSASGNITATGNVTGGNILTNGQVTATGNITANIVASTNNDGTGQNIKVGDDTWLGDINLSNTLSIRGQQDAANAYIVFGNASNVALGRAGTGPLTYGGDFSVSGNITGNTAGFAIGYRDIPQVSFAGNATIATTDAGKHFYSTQSTNYTLTIANNASQGFQVGAAITVVNQGTGTITIAQGSGVTLYIAGNATSGNRSVATFGMATLMKVATNTWFINGTGVS